VLLSHDEHSVAGGHLVCIGRSDVAEAVNKPLRRYLPGLDGSQALYAPKPSVTAGGYGLATGRRSLDAIMRS